MLKSWLCQRHRVHQAGSSMQGFRPILERLECRINPVPVAGISGRIWNDLNGDGIQDSAEPAVAGAIVDLVRDLDENPGSADDVVVESVIANSYGEYRFIASGDLRPHYIVFRPPVNDPPVTSSFSPADVGSDDAIDSDADPATGRTPHFDLSGSLDFDCGMVGDFPLVNDPPTFQVTSIVYVYKNSGPYSASWASHLNPGTPDEVGQNLTFEIVSNSAPELFSVAPAVDSAGTLTFTPAVDMAGTAHLAVRLKDDGGTANGGQDTSEAQYPIIHIVHFVNQAPSFLKGPDIVVYQESGPFVQSEWATNISAGSPEEANQQLQFLMHGNTNPSLFSVAPAISPDGTLTFTPANNAFGIATITVQLKDDGGAEDGGIDTSIVQTFTITIEPTLTVVGADAGGEPLVGLYSAGGLVHEEFLAYKNGFRGGVRVAVGDVNGDGVADIVTAPGAGMASVIKVWSGDGGALLSEFKAFPNAYQDGAHVTVGNFDADLNLEIAVSRGHGKGKVKVFDINGPIATQVGSFVAFGQRGARLAAGDFDGVDGDEIIVIAAQDGARVKVYGVEHGKATLQQSFVTHAKAKTGGFVAAADLNGDQLVEIIAGGVEGGVGTVKLYDGGTGDFLDSFTPYDPQASKSLRVATGDRNGDGQADTIVTAPGRGVLGPLVKRFDALSLDPIDEFFAHGTDGAFVAG